MFSQGSCIDVIQELLKSLYYHMERALAFSFSFPLAQQLVINHLGVFFFLFSRILVFGRHWLSSWNRGAIESPEIYCSCLDIHVDAKNNLNLTISVSVNSRIYPF